MSKLISGAPGTVMSAIRWYVGAEFSADAGVAELLASTRTAATTMGPRNFVFMRVLLVNSAGAIIEDGCRPSAWLGALGSSILASCERRNRTSRAVRGRARRRQVESQENSWSSVDSLALTVDNWLWW